MTPAPPDWAIKAALEAAAQSPCRSKRGVALYSESHPYMAGATHNSPPGDVCPGRAVCAGRCSLLAVHAEMRAIINITDAHFHGALEMVHVELAPDGGVVACDGPSCAACSKHILDSGAVAGVWLYEAPRKYAMSAGWRVPRRSGRSRSRIPGTCGASPNGIVPVTGYCWWTVGERVWIAREDGTEAPPYAQAGPAWVRYTAADFHRVTLERVFPSRGSQ